MTKALERLWVFDSNRDISENWRECEPLHSVWFELAPFAKKESYRDSGARPPLVAASLASEMQLYLRDRISTGEFIVLGIQTSPNPQLAPVRIPNVYFSTGGISIDWGNNKISGVAHSYEEVRICLSSSLTSVVIEKTIAVTGKSKRGGGRPSEYPKTKTALETLFIDKFNRTLPAEKLIDRVNQHRRIANPSDPPIHERTLRSHLQRYRKELAETGNN